MECFLVPPALPAFFSALLPLPRHGLPLQPGAPEKDHAGSSARLLSLPGAKGSHHLLWLLPSETLPSMGLGGTLVSLVRRQEVVLEGVCWT